MRLINTADWHLGHSLHGISRDYEHARFLTWLGEQLEQRRADGLIVCGDLFDSANPPASAQSLMCWREPSSSGSSERRNLIEPRQ